VWDVVSSDLITKCVKNTRPYIEVIDDHNDPFERKDELQQQQLVHGIDSTYNALTFISSDDQPGMTEIPTGEKRSRTISYDKDDEIAAGP